MNVIIDNQYPKNLFPDYEKIIVSVAGEAADYVRCPYECEVNVTIVDNGTIHRLNLQHRGMDMPTDVLSFPMLEYEKPADFDGLGRDISNFNPDSGELLLGDIIISYDKVLSGAEEYGHSPVRELAFLVAHSMLHLFGYDHVEEKERNCMETMQENILEKLNITRDIK